ncbi:MAG: tetratricopeptide repeat protein [bacterium]
MKIKYLIPCFLIILLCGGCVYYNTFYNAKKYYGLARASQIERLKENPYDSIKASSAESDNFKKSVEKSSKVLEQYPSKRKYIDKAILLLGKAFYYRGDYSKAVRKFTELVNNYTKSRLYFEAGFYLGMALYQKKSFIGAQKAFETLIKEDSLNSAWSVKAKFMLAQIAIDNDHQEIALDLFEKYKGLAGDKYLSNLMHYKIANIEHLRGNFQKAIQNYQQVEYVRVPMIYQDLKFEPEMDYRAKFSIGRCLRDDNKPYLALKHYNNLMNHDEFSLHFNKIRLQTGNILLELDSIYEAISSFQSICIEIENTREKAEALFSLGMIQEKRFGNLDSALRLYDSSIAVFGSSENAEMARSRSNSIRKLMKLRGLLEKGKKDSIIDTSFINDTTVLKDSTDTLSIKISQSMADTISSAQRNYAIAEIFLFELEIPDSALAVLDTIIMDTVKDSVYAPKAIYAKAWILDNFKKSQKQLADTLYNSIIKKYPNTIYAKTSQEALGLDVTIMTREDSALKEFHEAEAYFENREFARTAIEKYKQVIQLFPNTLYAYKSQLAAAWIYNNVLFELDSAKVAYLNLEKMTKEETASPFYQMARGKLQGANLGLDDLYENKYSTQVLNTGIGPGIEVTNLEITGGINSYTASRTEQSIKKSITEALNIEVLPLYLEILKEKKATAGKVDITLSVSGDGGVNFHDIAYNDFRNDEIELALEETFAQIEFKPIDTDGEQIFHLVLTFYSTSERYHNNNDKKAPEAPESEFEENMRYRPGLNDNEP